MVLLIFFKFKKIFSIIKISSYIYCLVYRLETVYLFYFESRLKFVTKNYFKFTNLESKIL